MDLQCRHLVIFGCGYVGTALARAAMATGARVTALTRNPAKAEELRRRGTPEVLVADLAGMDWHRLLPADIELAVNCVSSGGGGVEGYRRSYLDGMRSVLRWAEGRRGPLDTLLYTSSTSVYPQGGGATIDEEAAVGGGRERAEILLETESLLRKSSAVQRWFVLRLAGIYGPGRHHLLDQLRTGADSIAGLPDTRLNIAHRDDIVSAILACLVAPAEVRNRTYNVTDGHPSPRREVTEWLCQQLGREPVRFTGATSGGAHRDGGETPDRVITSGRLQGELGWRPRHADYRSGYAELLRQV